MDRALPSVRPAVFKFVDWLDGFGETSFDHQSFFAGPIGGRAKSLYYRRPALGTIAVAPIIFCEAFVPSARQMFWHKQRFPIADAHYAMGFALLAQLTGDETYYDRAVHFLKVLEETRCPGYANYCWGYPFDWVTRTGVMAAGTPLITTDAVRLRGVLVRAPDRRRRALAAGHAVDRRACAATTSRTGRLAPDEATAGYNPLDTEGGVINASAYRAFLLMSASIQFSREDYRRAAERNLNFVLGAQQADGSWFYAADGVRDFRRPLPHLLRPEGARQDREAGRPRGVPARRSRPASATTCATCSTTSGLPKPFSSAPRLTVYRQELYDYAECINLGTLLRGRFKDARRTPANDRRGPAGPLAEEGRIVSLATPAHRMGQRPDAPLGAIAAVSKPLPFAFGRRTPRSPPDLRLHVSREFPA